MSAMHAKPQSANSQKVGAALLASATAVAAGLVAVSPQAKTATQLPAVAAHVKMTALSLPDPTILLQGIGAAAGYLESLGGYLPATLTQLVTGGTQLQGFLAEDAILPMQAVDELLYAATAQTASVVEPVVATVLAPFATTPPAQAITAALQTFLADAFLGPQAFNSGGLFGPSLLTPVFDLQYFAQPINALIAAATAFFAALSGGTSAMSGAAEVPKVQTAVAALSATTGSKTPHSGAAASTVSAVKATTSESTKSDTGNIKTDKHSRTSVIGGTGSKHAGHSAGSSGHGDNAGHGSHGK
jgi:hypothetical protein